MRFLLAAVLLSFGCERTDSAPDRVPADSPSPLSVYTVNYPLEYFAARIGGLHVSVSFPAPSGVDPTSWSPDSEPVSAYQQADLILLNGANYAKWVTTATLPASKLVDTSASFAERYVMIEDAVVHSHGPEGEHSHGEIASTTWLDPTLAIQHAAAIRDAFVTARPEHESDFHEGFAELERDLAAVDERLEIAISGGSEVMLVASSPVYQYFARRYGLSIPSVDFDPDVSPDDDGWHNLEHLLEGHAATWMLWEGEPVAATAEKLLRMGLQGAVVAPCARRPDSGDYLSVMNANAAAIEVVFSEE